MIDTSPNVTTLPAPRPSVISQLLPDGAILYCAEQELYFGLNRTGACVWEHLHPVCSTVDEVCDQVASRFANTEATPVRHHVQALLARLEEQRLVQPAHSSP
jgi:hypothetical protein